MGKCTSRHLFRYGGVVPTVISMIRILRWPYSSRPISEQECWLIKNIYGRWKKIKTFALHLFWVKKIWLRGFYLVSWVSFGKYIFHVVLEWTRIPRWFNLWSRGWYIAQQEVDRYFLESQIRCKTGDSFVLDLLVRVYGVLACLKVYFSITSVDFQEITFILVFDTAVGLFSSIFQRTHGEDIFYFG